MYVVAYGRSGERYSINQSINHREGNIIVLYLVKLLVAGDEMICKKK